MNILITGLTLHNNKGGPALALSLIDKLKKEFIDAQYYLSVPNNNNNLKLEEKWAKLYNINGVIGAVGVKELLYINLSRRHEFLNFLKDVALVIDLNALSYMDLPTQTYKQNLVRNLSIYTIRGLCNKLNIPLIRWTQSYGPFINYITKQIVKYDLKNQKNIFVRGEGSLKNMQQLLNNKNIVSFPDIAITLDRDEQYYNKHFKNKQYITLSPSSVIYSIDGDLHIEHFRQIIKYISNLKYDIVLVPHTLMTINPTLNNCDLKVCEKILEDIGLKNIYLVNEDLDVYNIKGVISNARLHIGARYHSIIASLSMHVPTIAFSWHEKYIDIMRMYHMDKYVYDGRADISQLFEFMEELNKKQEEIVKILKIQQNILEIEIEKNITLFMDNYNEL